MTEPTPVEIELSSGDEGTILLDVSAADMINMAIEVEGIQGPRGLPGDQGSIVLGEELTGVINGINATFTTEFPFVPNTVVVYLNGLAQRIIHDFQTIGTQTITMVVSPTPGEYVSADYERA